MRILFICHEYPPKQHGGIGSFTKLLAEKLADNGFVVEVIGYGMNNETTVSNENGVVVHRLPIAPKVKNKYFNILLDFYNRFSFHLKLKKHVNSTSPDIIESHEWTGPLFFKIKGPKLVVRLHGSNTAFREYMDLKRNILTAYFEKRTIKHADHVVSVSNHIAEITKSSFNLDFNSKTIYNGVDIHSFTPQECFRDKNKIIMVGRMHPFKGFENLFASLNHFFSINETVYFEFICTIIEEYKNRLLSLVDQVYHHRIRFLGRISNENLKDHYSSANLCILPSLSEAFPIIPLESMACGTPVIISDRFSAREIIQNDKDGFLVDVMNPHILANQIAKILKDQEIIESMRIKAHNRIVDHFSIEKTLADNVNFYESILSND